VIALLAAISGVHTLFFHRRTEASCAHSISNPALALAGAVTGFASALTGTGGPLVLVPILLWLGSPVLTAIGLSQAIQLPVSLAATAGNLYHGNLDLRLGGLLAVGMPLGIWLGSKLARALPRETLQRTVSLLLIAAGVLILSQVAAQFIPLIVDARAGSHGGIRGRFWSNWRDHWSGMLDIARSSKPESLKLRWRRDPEIRRTHCPRRAPLLPESLPRRPVPRSAPGAGLALPVQASGYIGGMSGGAAWETPERADWIRQLRFCA
jgi:hypothetical protein